MERGCLHIRALNPPPEIGSTGSHEVPAALGTGLGWAHDLVCPIRVKLRICTSHRNVMLPLPLDYFPFSFAGLELGRKEACGCWQPSYASLCGLRMKPAQRSLETSVFIQPLKRAVS